MTTVSHRSQDRDLPLNTDQGVGSLRDQIVVVTGASSGIGKAISLGLAAQGACLYLIGRNMETLETVAWQAREQSPKTCAYRADLAEDGDIRALAADLQRQGGRVDILIHSAGEIYHGELARAKISEFDAQYRANVRGPYLLTQVLLPLLRVGPGQIVFINSSSGLKARARGGQYSATKHALKAIADSLRDEVNADGVRVLSIFPGRTATPRTELLFQEEGKPYSRELLMQPEDVAAMVIHALRMPRTAEVTEISMRSLFKAY